MQGRIERPCSLNRTERIERTMPRKISSWDAKNRLFPYREHTWDKKVRAGIKAQFPATEGWILTFHAKGPEAGSVTVERVKPKGLSPEAQVAWISDNAHLVVMRIMSVAGCENATMTAQYDNWSRNSYYNSKEFRCVRVRVDGFQRIRPVVTDDIRADETRVALALAERTADQYFYLLSPLARAAEGETVQTMHQILMKNVQKMSEAEEIFIDLDDESTEALLKAVQIALDEKIGKEKFLDQKGRISISKRTELIDGKPRFKAWIVKTEYVRGYGASFGDAERTKFSIETDDPILAMQTVRKYRDLGDDFPDYEWKDYVSILEAAFDAQQSIIDNANAEIAGLETALSDFD